MIILRQRTFSEEPEQKEFNSKAQKLLRRASDYKVGFLRGDGRLINASKEELKELGTFISKDPYAADYLKAGRRIIKDPGKLGGVNQSINMKAQSSSLTSGANAMRSAELEGKRGLKSYKNAPDQKKVMKNYDHGKVDKDRKTAAKEIIRLNH